MDEAKLIRHKKTQTTEKGHVTSKTLPLWVGKPRATGKVTFNTKNGYQASLKIACE